MAAVATFLRHKNIQTLEKDFDLNPEEPADIIYLPSREKFQVTQSLGEIGKLINRGSVSFTHHADDTFKDFIETPVRKKTEKYGGGEVVCDITLLIYENVESPWLNKEVAKIKKDPQKYGFLKNSGFKAIYCVFNFQDTNGLIQLYP